MKNKKKTLYGSEIPDDWEIKRFDEVFSFQKTFSFSRAQLTDSPNECKIMNIHYGDIHTTFNDEVLDFDEVSNVPFLIDGLIPSTYVMDSEFPKLMDGDLMIADASEDYKGVCDCIELKNVRDRIVIGGTHTYAARASQSNVQLGYRTYTLKHPQVIYKLKQIATGISVYGVSKTNLSKLKIPLPPLPEQKAIAAVLSTWDDAIQTTEKLITQKELRKNWLMQQLLTGKKRLAGFGSTSQYHQTSLGLTVPNDWKLVRVKDIFKERKETSSDQIQYPLYSLTIEKGLTEKTERYERSFLLKNQQENLYLMIYPNDILFNPMNLRFGAIAKSKIESIVSVSAYYNSIYTKSKDVDIDFFEILFKTPQLINLYERIAIGSLVEKKRVHLSNFIELEVPLPSLSEQTAIAEVLRSADNELSLLRAKTAKLREQKRGLMQQLLTGKRRLAV